MTEVVILPAPSADDMVVAFRGMIYAASRKQLAALGKEDDYFNHLPADHREVIRAAIAAEWFDVKYMESHYEAMGAVFHDPEQQIANGYAISGTLHSFIANTVTQPLRLVGALTPVAIAKRFNLLWRRTYNGGGCGVIGTGDRTLRIYISGMRSMAQEYLPNAFLGVLRALLEMGAPKISVERLRSASTDTCAAYVAEW